jgi:hypothetical protein
MSVNNSHVHVTGAGSIFLSMANLPIDRYEPRNQDLPTANVENSERRNSQ